MDNLETKTHKQEYTLFQKVRVTGSDCFKLISNVALIGTIPLTMASIVSIPQMLKYPEDLAYFIPLITAFGGGMLHQGSGIIAEIIGPRGHYKHITPISD